ncbi:MAG: hydrogenase maturation protease [Cyanobacteria bacterium]|nr:hydrogenase maturation protease [Cyanobacteriota bacterium]
MVSKKESESVSSLLALQLFSCVHLCPMKRELRSDKSRGGLVIIGVGNPLIDNDSIGLKVVKQLSLSGISEVCMINLETNFSLFADIIEIHDQVVIVDSMSSGGQSGNIVQLELTPEILQRGVPEEYKFATTHSLSWLDELRMCSVSARWPRTVLFVGIEHGTNEAIIEESCKAIIESRHFKGHISFSSVVYSAPSDCSRVEQLNMSEDDKANEVVS